MFTSMLTPEQVASLQTQIAACARHPAIFQIWTVYVLRLVFRRDQKLASIAVVGTGPYPSPEDLKAGFATLSNHTSMT